MMPKEPVTQDTLVLVLELKNRTEHQLGLKEEKDKSIILIFDAVVLFLISFSLLIKVVLHKTNRLKCDL